MNRHDLRGWFVAEVMEHLGRTGQHSRDFSREAVGNTRFMEQLMDGANPRLDTVQIAINYIDERKPADQLDMLS